MKFDPIKWRLWPKLWRIVRNSLVNGQCWPKNLKTSFYTNVCTICCFPVFVTLNSCLVNKALKSSISHMFPISLWNSIKWIVLYNERMVRNICIDWDMSTKKKHHIKGINKLISIFIWLYNVFVSMLWCHVYVIIHFYFNCN